MNAVEKINQELRSLDFHANIVDFPEFNQGRVVVFDYKVTTGRYRNRTFSVGISFQEEGYPEYPPHFFHVENLPHSHLTRHSVHRSGDAEWSVFSFPPSDFWDALPAADKNMRTYVNRHMLRIWYRL